LSNVLYVYSIRHAQQCGLKQPSLTHDTLTTTLLTGVMLLDML
jgi:hypothetical protein